MGSGRQNTNPSSSTILEERRLHREYYSTVHEVRVREQHLDKGTVKVEFLRGGNSRTVPFPVLGFSIPPKVSVTDKNYLRASWGVYFPQVGDVMKLGFDALGRPHIVGSGALDFSALKRLDDANEDRGGIGWGDASGKRLKPGDWSFKSARGSSLYLGDRTILSSGPYAIVLDKPNGEIKIVGDLIHTWPGFMEKREGSTKRIPVPGVDAEERSLFDFVTPGAIPGVAGQEHTLYVKRTAQPLPVLMVRTSEGQVVDDYLRQISGPLLVSPTSGLGVALTGTATRILRETYDDAAGIIPMWTEMVDNMGNWGMASLVGTGLQWNTPLATWTVTNLTTNWTSSATQSITVGGTYNVTAGGLIGVTAGATVDLTAAGVMTFTAPAIGLAAASISLGASPVVLTAKDAFTLASSAGPMTFTSGSSVSLSATTSVDLTASSVLGLQGGVSISAFSPIINLSGARVNLGTAPTDFLLKGNTMNASLIAYLTAVATAMTALAAVPLFLPGTAQFTAIATAAAAAIAALPASLSAVSKTG